jgi:hypothetical protein
MEFRQLRQKTKTTTAREYGSKSMYFSEKSDESNCYLERYVHLW